MPYINIKTNQSIGSREEEAIKSRLGQAIEAIPGKTEDWLMVGFEPEYPLWFRGTDEPAAMVEVSIYGGAPGEAYDELTAHITDLLCACLDLDSTRIYVKYSECEFWGWNGANF